MAAATGAVIEQLQELPCELFESVVELCWHASPLRKPCQVDEIVVTGQRLSGDDYSGIPAVVLQRRGDFLVQRIRLTNDTRAEEARIDELRQTIRDMVSDASKKPGIALSHGDEFLMPITSTAVDVALSPGGKRADTSTTSIYVKMALRESPRARSD